MISIVRGSVIDCDTDAIVNAANARLRGGGGLDGAIHAKAGPGLLRELERVHSGWANAGDVVVTGAHDLSQRYIFHAVGPIWRGGGVGEPDALARCYRGCVEHAARLGIASLGFCSISTGIYGYPIGLAAPLALQTVAEALEQDRGSLNRVVFAMFREDEHDAFVHAFDALGLRHT